MRAVEPKEAQLPYLETFSKAAELSSFTGAAKVLRLTQASVSQRVQGLERALGTPLFKRQAGRVLLTEAGQKLYDYAQRILDLHRQARQEITGREAPLGGDLSLAASSIPGEHLLPSLLSLFGKKHSHVRVRATVSDSMAVIAQVERGEVNLGLVGRKTDNPHLDFRYLASDKMVLVVPPGHALSRRKKLSVKQLPRHPLVLREVGSGLRHCFSPLGEKATAMTPASCPTRVRRRPPEATSQRRVRWSAQATATVRPSGEKATASGPAVHFLFPRACAWGSSGRMFRIRSIRRFAGSNRHTSPILPAKAPRPVADNATSMTVR